jgi:hypothetical protein
MKSWYQDRIPLTCGAAGEALYMSVLGVGIAFFILSWIMWLADRGYLDILK